MVTIPESWIHEETLGPKEVAKIFDVDPRTVTQWAKDGVIGFFRTPTGMRRFPACEVARVMAGGEAPDFLKEYATLDAKKFRDMWKGGWHRGSTAIRIKDDDE